MLRKKLREYFPSDEDMNQTISSKVLISIVIGVCFLIISSFKTYQGRFIIFVVCIISILLGQTLYNSYTETDSDSIGTSLLKNYPKDIIPKSPIPEIRKSESPITESPIPESPIPESPISESPIPESTIPESPIPESLIPEHDILLNKVNVYTQATKLE